jgi:hypothetical protein
MQVVDEAAQRRHVKEMWQRNQWKDGADHGRMPPTLITPPPGSHRSTTSFTSPLSQGDASKDETTPEPHRLPIRGIQGFHLGGGQGDGVGPRCRLQGGEIA